MTSLYSFTRTIADTPGTSNLLRNYFRASKYNTKSNKKLIEEFKKIEAWLEEPILITSADSSDIEDFKTKTIDLMPLDVHERFFEILKKIEPIHNNLIWEPLENDLLVAKNKYESLLNQLNKKHKVLSKMYRFYDSKWDKKIPIKVIINPLPKIKATTGSQSIANIQFMNLIVQNQDEEIIRKNLGIIVHEISHTLFNKQNSSTVRLIKKYFKKNHTPYSKQVFALLNEVFATSIGNAWIYSLLGGDVEKKELYNDKYINGTTKLVYKDVEKYLDNYKKIDPYLLETMTNKYELEFPESPFEYQALFNRIIISTESADTREIKTKLKKNKFRLEWISLASPLSANKSLNILLENKEKSVFIVVYNNEVSVLKNLIPKMPELSKYKDELLNTKENYLFSVLDKKDFYPIVILKVSKTSDIEKGIKLMIKNRTLNKEKNMIKGNNWVLNKTKV